MKYSALLAVTALFLLSACGQKGPLFLPGDPDEIRTDVPPATDADSEDEDDEQQQP